MKLWEHAAIGLSSGALLYITSFDLPFVTLLIFTGIVIGSVMPEIDGNCPKNYQHNPLRFWAAYVNYLFLYPFIMVVYRTKELHRRDLSTVPAIGILAILFYSAYWIAGQFTKVPFPVEPVIVGIFIGGMCTIAAHIGTNGGTRPFFPILKWWLHGTIEPRAPGEKRPKILIVLPLSLLALEVIGGNQFPVIQTPVLNFNQWALVVIWIGYFMAAMTISLQGVTSRLKQKVELLAGSQTPFHSDVERYNFEALNTVRREHGLRELKFDRRNAELSRCHSCTMANAGYIFHGDNVRRARGSYKGENVAEIHRGWVEGFNEPIWSEWDVGYAFHHMWMNSAGHRDNMLNPKFRRVGIGIYQDGERYFATQLFSN